MTGRFRGMAVAVALALGWAVVSMPPSAAASTCVPPDQVLALADAGMDSWVTPDQVYRMIGRPDRGSVSVRASEWDRVCGAQEGHVWIDWGLGYLNGRKVWSMVRIDFASDQPPASCAPKRNLKRIRHGMTLRQANQVAGAYGSYRWLNVNYHSGASDQFALWWGVCGSSRLRAMVYGKDFLVGSAFFGTGDMGVF